MHSEIRINRDFNDDILWEQVRLTFSQLPTMQVTSFIVALILCYAVRHIVPRANIFAWILMVLSVVAGRIVLYYRFLSVRDQPFAGRRALREQQPISLIMLDIDHFKLYNDNYGHQGGDDCLRKVAGVIAGSVKRPADLAARYGGEEFMVLLPDTDIRGATDIAEKLRIEVEILGVPHAFSATASVVTISIGVASLVPGQNTASSHLIKQVDTMLYAAKHGWAQQGQGRVKSIRSWQEAPVSCPAEKGREQ